LALCLGALLDQTLPPLEVIVVDNAADQSAGAIVRQFAAHYQPRSIPLHYQASDRNSLPVARNLGVKLALGDIVLFLDDDFMPERNYLDEILKVYETNPAALGVQGYDLNNTERPRFWRRLFFLPNVAPGMCRVIPSIRSVYPLAPDTVIACEWLVGCNAAYRRSILSDFPGDENLIKYSFAEDFDQSYRIFKRYPNSLWLTPAARGRHKRSPAGRAASREHTYLTEVYGLYLFYKLFPHTLRNQAIYWWSFFGRLLGEVKHFSRATWAVAGHRLGAAALCARHLSEIKRGELHFFNRTLTG
jgi:GT2 family glycosyltransferase